MWQADLLPLWSGPPLPLWLRPLLLLMLFHPHTEEEYVTNSAIFASHRQRFPEIKLVATTTVHVVVLAGDSVMLVGDAAILAVVMVMQDFNVLHMLPEYVYFGFLFERCQFINTFVY